MSCRNAIHRQFIFASIKQIISRLRRLKADEVGINNPRTPGPRTHRHYALYLRPGECGPLDAYLALVGIGADGGGPLFRRIHGPTDKLLWERLTSQAVFQMVRRRAEAAGLPPVYGYHSFRATGITAFRKNGGSLEKSQHIAAHASSATTKLYDRSQEDVTLEEVERIRI